METNAARDEHSALAVGSGCMAVMGIIFGCGISLLVLVTGGIASLGPSGSQVPVPLETFSARLLLDAVRFGILPALAFAGTVTLCFHAIVRPVLPANGVRRWAGLTFASALGYTVLFAATFYLVLPPVLGPLNSQLLLAGGVAQAGVVGLIGLAGAFLGLVSGSALSVGQWASLRMYTQDARRFSVAIAAGNALLVGVCLAVFMWLMHTFRGG